MSAFHSKALAGVVLPLALWAASATPGRASGDVCEPRWRIDAGVLGDCDTLAALSPGNDTRANLLLLLFDRHGLPPSSPAPDAKPILSWRDFRDAFTPGHPPDGSTYAAGEGSRCRSDEAGASAFGAAVGAAAGLPPEDRAALLAARAALKPVCAGPSAAASPAPTPALPAPPLVDAAAGVRSDLGHAFAAYLTGAQAFYGARYDEAARLFEPLRTSPDPWLADTADYMVARTGVNRLQTDAFDEYGTLKAGFVADPDAATRVGAALDTYLKAHPDGRYAVSARGLQRRVDWLAGWTEKLAGRYAALLAQPASARGVDDLSLVEEIDDKLLPKLTMAQTRDPLLLAVMDLKSMRRDVGKPGAPPPVDLAAQRDAFAGATPLYELLLASSSFYVDGAPLPVLRGLPDDARRRDGDYLWFSRQFLRGQALEAAHDRNAPGFWRELDPSAGRPMTRSLVELALALDAEAHGRLDAVFSPDSLVTDPTMRRILLENEAGPALLRARALDASAPKAERDAALSTLLYKSLTRGHYADFLADLKTVPADAPASPPSSLTVFVHGRSAGEIGCPPLAATAAQLAADPGAMRARLCLAEFVRLNDMDGDALDKPPPKGELGGAPTDFPGTPYARAATYASVIADRGAPADDRAYALYRAVRCYQPSGDNGCGGPEATKATRHGWFDALKRDYPGSRWAKRLNLWW